MKALVEQEFRDAGYDELVRRSAEFNRFGRDQSTYAISEIAALYIRHRPHWREFLQAHGIASKPRRGPTARSIFQPICRHLLGLGESGDSMGLASVWAAVLDEWVETEISPAEIPTWIADRGGMRAIYEGCDPIPRPDSDIVYTSPNLARRIVDYLNPQGFCVDPCRGRGAFYDALDPENRDWCEIREGRDFLTWEFDRPVDWCITNPPFSDAYADIAARAFSISENVAFLVKLPVAIGTYARHRAWREAGHGLREIIYLPWADAEFVTEDDTEKAPEGFVLAVVWWQRGWRGDVRHTDWTSSASSMAEVYINNKVIPFYDLIDEQNTTSEWYTPPYIFDAVGCDFDLDPASPGADVVPWIPARRHYTKAGLEQEWSGFVWLNPPYGRDILPGWIDKFIEHGNGIALVPDRGSTGWWQELAVHANLILFLNKKISFVNAAGEQSGACAIGSTLVAIGKKAVNGLIAASQNGLGLLLKPVPAIQETVIEASEAAD